MYGKPGLPRAFCCHGTPAGDAISTALPWPLCLSGAHHRHWNMIYSLNPLFGVRQPIVLIHGFTYFNEKILKLNAVILNVDWLQSTGRAPSQHKDSLSRHRISIIMIRRSWDRLISIMGIPILVRRRLCIVALRWSHNASTTINALCNPFWTTRATYLFYKHGLVRSIFNVRNGEIPTPCLYVGCNYSSKP